MKIDTDSAPFITSKMAQNIIFLLVSGFVAVLFRYAIPTAAREGYSIGFIPIVVWLTVFLLFKTTYQTVRKRSGNRRELVVTIFVSLLFSFFTVFGAFITSANEIGMPHLVLLLISALAISVPIFFLIIWLWSKLDGIQGDGSADTQKRVKHFLIPFLVLTIAWTPYFLASYPGFFIYDVNSEWNQFEAGKLSPSSPVMHTLILGSIMKLGMLFHDTYNFGIAFFISLQALFVAFAFSCALLWIRNQGTSKLLYWGSLLYFALDPVIACFALCACKDNLFSAMAVLLMVISYGLMRKERPDRNTACIICLFVICGVIFCNVRYNGLYIFALWSIILLVLCSKHMRLVLTTACVSILILSILWLGCISDALGVKKSGDENDHVAFLIPQQQIAFVVANDKATEEELIFLEENGYILSQSFKDNTADLTYNTISGMTTSQIINCYWRLGVNHPGDYLISFLKMTQDSWNPYSYVDCYNGIVEHYNVHETSFFSANIAPPGTQDSKLPSFMSFIESISLDLVLQKIPLLSLLVSVPFYVWITLLVLSRVIIVGNRASIAMMMFMFLCALSAFVGPCVLPRYYLPLFFGLPLILYCGLYSKKQPKISRA